MNADLNYSQFINTVKNEINTQIGDNRFANYKIEINYNVNGNKVVSKGGRFSNIDESIRSLQASQQKALLDKKEGRTIADERNHFKDIEIKVVKTTTGHVRDAVSSFITMIPRVLSSVRDTLFPDRSAAERRELFNSVQSMRADQKCTVLAPASTTTALPLSTLSNEPEDPESVCVIYQFLRDLPCSRMIINGKDATAYVNTSDTEDKKNPHLIETYRKLENALGADRMKNLQFILQQGTCASSAEKLHFQYHHQDLLQHAIEDKSAGIKPINIMVSVEGNRAVIKFYVLYELIDTNNPDADDKLCIAATKTLSIPLSDLDESWLDGVDEADFLPNTTITEKFSRLYSSQAEAIKETCPPELRPPEGTSPSAAGG